MGDDDYSRLRKVAGLQDEVLVGARKLGDDAGLSWFRIPRSDLDSVQGIRSVARYFNSHSMDVEIAHD